jgi:thiol-disulfide isomerase/thioredoxin
MGSLGRSPASRVLRCLLIVGALMSAACASKPAPAVGVSTVERGGAVSFAFDSLDERPVSSQALRGRPIVLAFVTTWDLPSQVQTRYLTALKTTASIALVALDTRANRELVEAYAKTLNVSYPVALAAPTDSSSGIQTFGDFGEIAVPTVIVLDAEGRIIFRRNGLCKTEDIDAALR